MEQKGHAKVETEKAITVMGSCAGAGSGEFHMYLNSRNREKFRIESIDAQRRQEEEARKFQEKLEINKKLDEERLQKNAKKRLRQKQRKEKNKKKAKGSIDGDKSNDKKSEDNDSDGSEDGAEEEEPQEY